MVRDSVKKRILTKTHALTVILDVGKAAVNKGAARKGDVLRASESGSRAKAERLKEMIAEGYVVELQEFSRPCNVKHLTLTPRGWKIYYAVKDDDEE